MTRTLLALALAGIASAAGAQQWVIVGDNGRQMYEAQAGSQARSANANGDRMTVVTGRVREGTRTTAVQRWYVRDRDCERGIGHLVVLRASGEWAYDIEIAIGETSVASTIASVLCDLRVSLDNDRAPAPAPAPPAWQPAGRL